jgi:hypothetical protein
MRRIVWLLPLLVSTSALANSPLNHPPLPVEEPVSTVRCASFGFNPSYAQCTQLWFDKRGNALPTPSGTSRFQGAFLRPEFGG